MFKSRIMRLREKLIELKLDAVLISNFHNILYLTGFKTLTTDEREAFVLVTNSQVYLFSDARYLTQTGEQEINNQLVEARLIMPGKSMINHLQTIVEVNKISSIGFEGEDLKFSEYQSLKNYLPNCDLVSTNKLIVKIREIKSDFEIEQITHACAVGDQVLQELLPNIQPNITEKELAFKLELAIKEKGYDSGFYPIIAFDKNSSLPHYNTKNGSGILGEKGVVLIDFGVKYHDYISDITRMVFVGNPSQELTNIYQALLDAQVNTISQIKVGNDAKAIDLFCRKSLLDNKIQEYSHSTGHGVGLEVHEYPKISQNSQDKVCKNQVFTIEPGVYLEGKWGMRIEDTVVVDDNQVRALTAFNKALLIL